MNMFYRSLQLLLISLITCVPAAIASSIFEKPAKWQYLKHIPGSGGGMGVHVFQDPESGRIYTVKGAVHANHLIEEIVAKACYQALGFKVSKFTIIDRTKWPNHWNQYFELSPRVLVSEYVEVGPADKGEHKEKVMRWVEVLLGNFDLAGHNYIVDPAGDVVPIDFGGSLRLRANGDLKAHEKLWGYFWPGADLSNLDTFKSSWPKLFEVLSDMHRQMCIHNFSSLWNIMASRVHSLLATINPEGAPQFYGDRPAVVGKMAAGVLFVTHIDGRAYGLVGKRLQDGKLSDIGGGANANDRSLNRTAWREAVEETGGFIPLGYSDLIQSPYVECKGDVLYRMFLHTLESIDIDGLNAHIKSKANPYAQEVSEFVLVPLDELADHNNLFAPMRELLVMPHTQNIMREVAKGYAWKLEKGGSVYQGRMRLGDYSFEVAKLDFLDENAFNAKAAAAAQLKSRFAQQNFPQAGQVTPYTQTGGFLKILLGDRFRADDQSAVLKAVILEKSRLFKGKPDELEARFPLIKKIVDAENEYPQHYSYVHGNRGDYGLLCLIASALRSELFLNHDQSAKTLRLYENAFDGIDSVAAHLASVSQEDDYTLGGQARVLSTNMSILGALGKESCETLEYFFLNLSLAPPEGAENILRAFLTDALKLPGVAVEQFLSAMKPFFTSLDKVGVLYQLFVLKADAEKHTYLSFQKGKRASFGDAPADRLHSTTVFIDVLRNTPEALNNLMHQHLFEYQSRVMLHPDMIYGNNVVAKLYFADDRSIQPIMAAVREAIARSILPHLRLAQSRQAYTCPPPIVLLNRLITGDVQETENPALKRLVELAKCYWQNKDQIWELLKDSSVAKLEEINHLTLKRQRALDQHPMLGPLADWLLMKLESVTQEGWVALLDQIKAACNKLSDFLGNQSMEAEVLSGCLAVDPEDHDFTKVREIVKSPEVHKMLQADNRWDIYSSLGKVIQVLAEWGDSRAEILERMEALGLLTYKENRSSTADRGNSGLASLPNAQVTLNVLQMLQEENLGLVARLDKMFHANPMLAYDYNASQADFGLIQTIAEYGVEDSRAMLRQIRQDFANETISFAAASYLLQQKKILGAKWDERVMVYKTFVKPNVIIDLESGFGLFTEQSPQKLEESIAALHLNGPLDWRLVHAFKGFVAELCRKPNIPAFIECITPILDGSKDWDLMNRLVEINDPVLLTRVYTSIYLPKGRAHLHGIGYMVDEMFSLTSQEKDRVIEILAHPDIRISDIYMMRDFTNVLKGHKEKWQLEHIGKVVAVASKLRCAEAALSWGLSQAPEDFENVAKVLQKGFASKQFASYALQQLKAQPVQARPANYYDDRW